MIRTFSSESFDLLDFSPIMGFLDQRSAVPMPGELERLLDALIRPRANATQSSNVLAASGPETINVLSADSAITDTGTIDEVLCLGLTCDLLEHNADGPNGEVMGHDTMCLLGVGVMPI